MSMVSMKRARVEQQGGTLLSEAPDASRDDYYYGLRVSLEEPELQKLGWEEVKVDSSMPLMAVAKVVSYSKDESGRRVELQLTALGVPETEKKEERVEVMYPKGA